MQIIRKTIDTYHSQLIKFFKISREFAGYLMVYWGENLLGVRKKYRLISTVIEHILQSRDVRVLVIKTYDHPLIVRFKLKVRVPEPYDIDNEYFRRELAIQLGCQLSDINTDVDNGDYFVEITKTAINNMEKGCTPYMPQAYEANFLDEMIEEARQLVLKEGKGSAHFLQEKLQISYDRAARILDELESMGVLTPPDGDKPRKLVN